MSSQVVRRIVAATACVFLYSGSLSAAPEPVIPPAYVVVAREIDVPPRVLYAMALTESARHLRTTELRPWPWSLNVNGRAEYHASREAAYRALRRHLATGRRSIDIGLMQLNWRWHRALLRDPWQALDPYHNLRTGARLLREHYQECGDWLTAVGRYHAPATTKHARVLAQRYRTRVARQLAQLNRQG